MQNDLLTTSTFSKAVKDALASNGETWTSSPSILSALKNQPMLRGNLLVILPTKNLHLSVKILFGCGLHCSDWGGSSKKKYRQEDCLFDNWCVSISLAMVCLFVSGTESLLGKSSAVTDCLKTSRKRISALNMANFCMPRVFTCLAIAVSLSS